MRRVFLVTATLIVVFGSCKPSTKPVSELDEINFKYYKKLTQNLFTGIATTKFENGLISSSTEIKEGIPNGNWIDFGYSGEMIHQGKYQPIQLKELTEKIKNIKRLNISFWKEGDNSFIDVYIVGQNLFGARFDTLKLKKDIEQLLHEKNLIDRRDSINEVKIVKGELE